MYIEIKVKVDEDSRAFLGVQDNGFLKTFNSRDRQRDNCIIYIALLSITVGANVECFQSQIHHQFQVLPAQTISGLLTPNLASSIEQLG